MKNAYFLVTVSPKTQKIISKDGPYPSSADVRNSFEYNEASGFTKTHLSYFEISAPSNASATELQTVFDQNKETLESLR